MQIIGRATRDAPGKTRARFTNLIAEPDASEEAEAALIALGYRPQEASRAISRVAEEGMSREELIRQALKAMVPAG